MCTILTVIYDFQIACVCVIRVVSLDDLRHILRYIDANSLLVALDSKNTRCRLRHSGNIVYLINNLRRYLSHNGDIRRVIRRVYRLIHCLINRHIHLCQDRT